MALPPVRRRFSAEAGRGRPHTIAGEVLSCQWRFYLRGLRLHYLHRSEARHMLAASVVGERTKLTALKRLFAASYRWKSSSCSVYFFGLAVSSSRTIYANISKTVRPWCQILSLKLRIPIITANQKKMTGQYCGNAGLRFLQF